MPSPYPWHYSVRWPFYFRWPSIRNHTGIGRMPLALRFSPQEPEPPLKLLFCGDIMVMQQDIVPTLHPDLCALVRSADLFIGNCEAPVGKHARDPRVRYHFNFHMPRSFLADIVDQTGLPPERWVLTMANNHAGDRGYQAFLNSVDVLGELGIHGIGRWQRDGVPLTTLRHGGLTLGVAAWTRWMNNEVFSKDRGVYRAADTARVDFRELRRREGLDVLIAMPHWEYEFQHFPHRESRQDARRRIEEQGFDLIVGSHPHTLQPMERIGGGLCVYSLGNFCGLGNAWSVKLISLLEVHLSRAPGRLGRINAYRLHPFVQLHGDGTVTLVPLSRSPDRIRRRIEQRLRLIVDIDDNPGFAAPGLEEAFGR